MKGTLRQRPVHAWLAAGLLAVAALGSLTACGGSRQDPVEASLPDHLGAAVLTGWSPAGEPAVYDASTLYQRVNGEDGLYLGAGFARLTTVELKQHGRRGTTAVVDVFELGSVLSAFGIYSRLHEEEAVVPRIGTSACIYGGFAVLYKDRIVVKINADPTAASGAEPAPGLAELAALIADGLPGAAAPPCELGYLPPDGLVAGSATYVEAALNGHDFLPGGLQADYQVDGQEVSVFVSLLPNPEAADAARGQYTEALGGAEGEQVSVAAQGRFLVGARGFEDPRTAVKLIQGTLEAIEGHGDCPAAGG